MIFTWVKAVLLDPLQGVVRQRDLVAVATETRDGGYVGLSYPDYRDYRKRRAVADFGARLSSAARLRCSFFL